MEGLTKGLGMVDFPRLGCPAGFVRIIDWLNEWTNEHMHIWMNVWNECKWMHASMHVITKASFSIQLSVFTKISLQNWNRVFRWSTAVKYHDPHILDPVYPVVFKTQTFPTHHDAIRNKWHKTPPKKNELVVSTHLKNICQLGNLPQIGVKIKTIWTHQLEKCRKCYKTIGFSGWFSFGLGWPLFSLKECSSWKGCWKKKTWGGGGDSGFQKKLGWVFSPKFGEDEAILTVFLPILLPEEILHQLIWVNIPSLFTEFWVAGFEASTVWVETSTFLTMGWCFHVGVSRFEKSSMANMGWWS